MNLTVAYSDNTTNTFSKVVAPTTYPRFAQVLNHVQWTAKYDPPARNILVYTNVAARFGGIPSVMQQIQTNTGNRTISLPDDIQWWMFSLFEECAPVGMSLADIKKCWRNAFMGAKAFTNKTGWDNGYRDVVLGENLNNPEGFKLMATICHGATVKVLRPPFYKAGIMQAEYEILNILDPSIVNRTYRDNRHLIFPAINWSRCYIWVNGKRVIDPSFYPHGRAEAFPLLNGRDVPIPLLGYGTTKGYIANDWLRYLSPNEPIPANPYWDSL